MKQEKNDVREQKNHADVDNYTTFIWNFMFVRFLRLRNHDADDDDT